jgi:hypothetical protein
MEVSAMEPDFSIELPEGTSQTTLQELTEELRDLDEVDEASEPQRSLIGSALVLIKVAGPALEAVSTAVPILQKIVGLIRGKGVSGATIELPDGTKLSVDNASVADIERLLQAATRA